jgi:hypothetical protein
VLEILNDTKDERDVIDDADLCASNDYTKPSFCAIRGFTIYRI